MQLTINASQQQTLLDYSQVSLNQNAKSGALPILPQRDRIELSDEARRPRDEEHGVEHLRRSHHTSENNPLLDFIKSMLEQLSGTLISDLQKTEPAAVPVPPARQSLSSSLAAQQTSLSVETSSLSISGSIKTADGATVAFSLDLQTIHASVASSGFNFSNGSDGNTFNFSGSSAELTSTSFSFSFSAQAPDGASSPGNGRGTFSLKNDLNELQNSLKPFLQDYLKESGMPSENNIVTQLLTTRV